MIYDAQKILDMKQEYRIYFSLISTLPHDKVSHLGKKGFFKKYDKFLFLFH